MDLDYSKLGLKCGLEVHQQLDTKKIFCNCPSILRLDEPEFIFKRKLHAVAGESGEVDIAAAHEARKEKEFTYQGYSTTCLVEIDEEPPRQINNDALKTALQISLLLNCRILPITQIMRKTVIDGSNTSGFQRTVLIAQNGFIDTALGRVGVASVCLEEDSARIISKTETETIYRLDRLGIPLIEIATDASIKTPQQAKEAALKIGEILRQTRVRRGLGTIRQDVNLSISGGKRIELKGFQDIRNIEKAIATEVLRQEALIETRKSVAEVRNVLEDGSSKFLRPLPGAARMYPETDLPLLKISRMMIDGAKKALEEKKPEELLAADGLSPDMITLILKNGKLEEFKELLHIVKNPQLVAKVSVVFPKEIASKEKKPIAEIEEILNRDFKVNLLEDLRLGKVKESEIKSMFERAVRGESFSGETLDLSEVEEKVVKIIKAKPGLSANAYMGLVMTQFKGKISGKDAVDIIKKHLR